MAKEIKVDLKEKGSINENLTKYKHKQSGDILTFVRFSTKPYQTTPWMVFTKDSDKTKVEVEYVIADVELIPS